MINKNPDEFYFLKHNKTGERFDLKRARKWLITSLPYDDTPKRRIDYLEYLYYKIYQNLCSYWVELD